MAIEDWSEVASENATQDGITWREGMMPSEINGSARQMMADIAAYVASNGTDITALQAGMAAAAIGGIVVVKKATRALLDADLAWAADSIGLVYADATSTNIDLYYKIGASGAGSWSAPTGILGTQAQVFAAAAAASAVLAAAEAASLTAAVQDVNKAKSRSDLLASTALSGYTSLILQAHSGSNSSANSDAARAFDAAATTTETTVAIGVPIDAVQAKCRLMGTPAFVRARIYERPLTSGALNTAPPNGVDDVLLSTTDLTPTECGWFTGHAGRVDLVIPLSAPFVPRSGYTYVIRVDSRDAGGVDLAVQFSYATVAAVAQRLAGWYHATAGAGAWTNQTTTRQICIGLSTAASVDIGEVADKADAVYTVYATPQEPSPLSEAEELCCSEGALNRIKWMGGSTTNEGLATTLFGDASWASNLGQENVDFSHTTALGSLTAGSASPYWDAGNNRINITTSSAGNDPSGVVVEGYHILGRVITSAGNVLPLTIRDCLIEDPGPGTYIYGVQQASPYDTLVTIENCKIYGHNTRSILGGNMIVRRTYCDFTGSDIIGNAGGAYELTVDECFFRRPSNVAFGNPLAHGDVFQGAGPLSLTRSTLYMPSGLLPAVDEGVVGSTNIVRMADAVDETTEAYVLGNLLIGGARPMDIWSRYATTVLKNFVVANNIFGGDDFSSQRDLDVRAPVGYQSNVAFYNNMRPDLGPISRDMFSSGTRTPVGNLVNGVYAGVYNFVKADMSAKFRYILGYKFGMLDPFNNLKAEYDLGAMT